MEAMSRYRNKLRTWDCIKEGALFYRTHFHFFGWMTLLFGLFIIPYVSSTTFSVYLSNTIESHWLFLLITGFFILLFLVIGLEVMVLMFAHHHNRGDVLSIKEVFYESKGKVWTYIGWHILINLIGYSILLIPNLIFNSIIAETWPSVIKVVFQLLVDIFVSSLYAFAPLIGILDYAHEGHLRNCRKIAWPYIGKLCIVCGLMPLILQLFLWFGGSSFFIALPSGFKIVITVVLVAVYSVLSFIMTLALYRAYCHVMPHQEESVIKDFSCSME